MKKLIFALPLLALAAVFTYCNKTDVPTPLNGAGADMPVTDRACGDKCPITIATTTVNANLQICGILNNQDPCAQCIGTGVYSSGYDVFNASEDYDFIACRPFSITNPNSFDVWVSFNGGNYALIPANSCVSFMVNDDCSVSLI